MNSTSSNHKEKNQDSLPAIVERKGTERMESANQYSNFSTPRRRKSSFMHRNSVHETKNLLPAEKKERTAWYLYNWANGSFFCFAMSFIPLMITSQARDTAKQQYCNYDQLCLQSAEWAIDYDFVGKCSDRAFDNNAAKCIGNGGLWEADILDDAKYVNILGIPIGFASVAPLCIAFSVVIQLIVYLSMGSFADFGANRKNMLVLFTTIGNLTLLLFFLFPQNSSYWINGLIWIVSIVCFSFATVFYNAFLPLLAKAHPDIIAKREKNIPDEEISQLEKEYTHAMSVKGLAIGFVGAFLFLVISFVLVFLVSTEAYFEIRIALFTASIWLIIFSTITFMYLKPRPGPPLPEGDSYCQHSFKTSLRTFKSFKELKELGKFLLAYFIFADGTSTLASSALVFAQEELNMSTKMIAISLLVVTFMAAFGCYIFKWLHEKTGLRAKTIVIINLCIMATIPIYSMFAMKYQWEFFVGIFLFGMNTGSQQAFTRSIFAHFIPMGRESEYFSFYQVTDKGSAWLGPLLIALVNQATGSYRHAFSALIVFFVFGVLLLLRFNPDVAMKEKQVFDVKHACESQSCITLIEPDNEV